MGWGVEANPLWLLPAENAWCNYAIDRTTILISEFKLYQYQFLGQNTFIWSCRYIYYHDGEKIGSFADVDLVAVVE